MNNGSATEKTLSQKENSSSNNEKDPKEHLISSLKEEGILKTKKVENALRKVKRENFLWPDEPKALAYIDEPLSLGMTGQTISAPHMVVVMLEVLELEKGLRVLEIGTGSGYNAALIGEIVGGKVTTIERDKELAEFARANLRKSGHENAVLVVEGDGSLGYPRDSTKRVYDRIVVTAASPDIPRPLARQLKMGGIMVVPVGNRTYQTLIRLRKSAIEPESFEREELFGCVFVPLVGKEAFQS